MTVLNGHGKLTPGEKAALQMFEIGATSTSAIATAIADDKTSGEETNAYLWVRLTQEAAQSNSTCHSMAHLCLTSVNC